MKKTTFLLFTAGCTFYPAASKMVSSLLKPGNFHSYIFSLPLSATDDLVNWLPVSELMGNLTWTLLAVKKTLCFVASLHL